MESNRALARLVTFNIVAILVLGVTVYFLFSERTINGLYLEDFPSFVGTLRKLGLRANASTAPMTEAKAVDPFSSMALRLSMPNRTIILSVVNNGTQEFFSNWVKSVARLGMADRVLAVATDKPMYEFLETHWPSHAFLYGFPAVHAGAAGAANVFGSDFANFGSAAFNTLSTVRATVIKKLVSLGLRVTYSDVDTYWIRDPFPILGEEYDVSLPDDSHTFKGVPTTDFSRGLDGRKEYLCTCFLDIFPTPGGMRFLDTWIESIKNNTDNTTGVVRYNDQRLLNQILNNPYLRKVKMDSIRLQVLSSSRFPSGSLGTNSLFKKHYFSRMVYFHANFVQGKLGKIKMLQNQGFWNP